MGVLLNGRVHDWVSAIFAFGPPIGRISMTVQSVTYPEHGQEKVLVYGAGRNPIGYTRDTYKVTTLETEFLRAEWATMKGQMLAGYGNLSVPAINFTYIDVIAALLPVSDTFISCAVTKEQPSVSQGTDPAKIRVTWQPNSMVLDGIPYTLIPAV